MKMIVKKAIRILFTAWPKLPITTTVSIKVTNK